MLVDVNGSAGPAGTTMPIADFKQIIANTRDAIQLLYEVPANQTNRLQFRDKTGPAKLMPSIFGHHFPAYKDPHLGTLDGVVGPENTDIFGDGDEAFNTFPTPYLIEVL